MTTPISAISGYLNARSTAKPDPTAGAEHSALGKAGDEFEQVLRKADEAAIGAMTGQTDTHELVQSIAEAELALDAAVAIRDKVVEAYQEILRMPV